MYEVGDLIEVDNKRYKVVFASGVGKNRHYGMLLVRLDGKAVCDSSTSYWFYEPKLKVVGAKKV